MPRCSQYAGGGRGSLAVVRWTVAAVCAFGVVHAAAAEPAPTPRPPAAPASPAAGAPPANLDARPDAAVDPRSDAVWQLYHEVFAALMRGERTRARELATTLLRDHPDHPATRLVRSAQLGLAPGAVDDHGDAPERRDRRDGRETPSRGARAELALFQSLHGIAVGAEICIAISCDTAESILGIPLLGGTIGAVVALNLHDLTSGQRALLDNGTAWGATNAGLVLIALNADDEATTIALGLMTGQLAGLAAGAGLFGLHPTAGQVALASSGGIWVGALTALTYTATGASLDQHQRATGALIAIDVGIVGGAYLASRWPAISRAQTLVIDAGGIAGTVAGASLGVLIEGKANGHTTPAVAAAGAAVGLGAAAYLTRDWNDGGAGSLHGYIAPPERGRGGVAGVAFAW
jgi:hypothetical protein